MIFYPLVLYVYELTVLRILFHFDADPGHGSNLKNGNGIKIGLDRVFEKKEMSEVYSSFVSYFLLKLYEPFKY